MDQFSVSVVYNGVTDPIEHVTPQESVGALLNRAEDAFKITANRHRLALFLDGRELPNSGSVAQAGVGVGTVLQLRARTVAGG